MENSLKNTKVSVIMSVYNGERHVRKAINSILEQTFRDFEFIIINDASAHTTSEILNKYANKDKRIKIITNQKNLGLTKSLNRGIKIAEGKYIARMDADDIAAPNRLRKQVDFMERNLEVGLVSSFAQFIDDNDNYLNQINKPKKEINKKELFFHSRIAHSSLMIRKSILDKVGDYDEKFLYSQDCDLAFRIIKFAKIAAIPEILLLWRNQKSSISTKRKWSQIKFEMLAYIKAINSGLYPFYYYFFLPILFLKSILPKSIKKILRGTN